MSPFDWTLCREARILPTSVVNVTSTSRLETEGVSYSVHFRK